MSKETFCVKDARYQILAACIIHGVVIPLGVNMAYTTVLLPQIMYSDDTDLNSTYINDTMTELRVDKHQATWIASLVNIATPIASLLVGPLMDRFGRKSICMWCNLPYVVAWGLFIYTSTQVYLLYIARLLAGVGGGLSIVSLVYVGEISHPLVRPMLLPLGSVFVSVGILVTTILGSYLHWKTVAMCFGLWSFLNFFLLLLVPESPVWLHSKSTAESKRNSADMRARKGLKWLYRKDHHYEEQYNLLFQADEQKKDQLLESEETFEDQRPYYKQVTVILILFLLQQFTGCYLVIYYAVQIFQWVGGDMGPGLDEFTALVTLGLIRFIMSVITVFLSKVVGRRSLLLFSGCGMTLCLFPCALYLKIEGGGIIPVILILGSVLFSAFGYMIIPWSLIGEILPMRIRGVGSGVVICISYVLMFITVKIFIYCVDYFGLYIVILSFCASCVLGNIFVYFYLPETLGRTDQQIEEAFYKKN